MIEDEAFAHQNAIKKLQDELASTNAKLTAAESRVATTAESRVATTANNRVWSTATGTQTEIITQRQALADKIRTITPLEQPAAGTVPKVEIAASNTELKTIEQINNEYAALKKLFDDAVEQQQTFVNRLILGGSFVFIAGLSYNGYVYYHLKQQEMKNQGVPGAKF